VEHRWGQRKPAYQRVRVLTAGGIAAHGHILNVSISGAFIRTPLPASVLSVVQVAIVADNRSRFSTTAAAQVVRKTAEGLGPEWCEHVPKIVGTLATTPAPGDSRTLTTSTPARETADAVGDGAAS
jgi:hypothetical protein